MLNLTKSKLVLMLTRQYSCLQILRTVMRIYCLIYPWNELCPQCCGKHSNPQGKRENFIFFPLHEIGRLAKVERALLSHIILFIV